MRTKSVFDAFVVEINCPLSKISSAIPANQEAAETGSHSVKPREVIKKRVMRKDEISTDYFDTNMVNV